MESTDNLPYPMLSRELSQDDDTNSATTEHRLLSSRNSSETIVSSTDSTCYRFKRQKSRCCGPWIKLSNGVFLVIIGVLSIIWTPFDILMTERLRMVPGLPPFEWWKNPPDEVLLRVYVFNITNSEEFLSGIDAKLRLQEVGPIIYKENLVHNNVSFNENGTLSYVATRTAVFVPEMNTIDLNQTLFLPNLAVLGMASFLWDAPFFTKFGFNLLLRSLDSQLIVQSTINDYLWNFSDPILDVAQTLAPSLVPVKNMGILSRIYTNFEDSVTVFVGPEHGHQKFFLIDKYDGDEFLPGYGSECEDKLLSSTEGVSYQQFLTKNSTLHYWRKTICKVTPLYFAREVEKYGVTAFRFELPNNTYDRTYPSYQDCYVSNPPLPNGLSEVSKCYYDFPMAASFPHFLHGDEILHTYVDGLEPNKLKHESFVIVEPTTGIPLESRARSQSNLVIRKLSGFNEMLERFGDTVVPMFWAEYNQIGIPFYISSLMYFTVMVLPHLQKVTTTIMIGSGLLLVFFAISKLVKRRNYHHLMKNQVLKFDEILFPIMK